MNEGFKKYYSDGFKKSIKVFKEEKSNFLKFYLLKFAGLFGKLIIFLNPFFALANIRLASDIKDHEKMYLFRSFRKASGVKAYLSALLSSLLKGLLWLGGVLMIALITGILFGLGYLLDVAINNPDYIILYGIIFAIPGAVALLVYLVLYPIYLAPTYYFIDSYVEAGASKALEYSYSTMKKEGKGTEFLLSFIPALIIILYLGVFGGGAALLFSIGEVISTIIAIVVILIGVVGLIILLPIFVLAGIIGKVSLYKDIQCVDDPNLMFSEGEEYSELKESVTREEALISLFEENKEESI